MFGTNSKFRQFCPDHNNESKYHQKKKLECLFASPQSWLAMENMVFKQHYISSNPKRFLRNHWDITKIYSPKTISNNSLLLLSSQLLNLEDESVETTKIIADMERGHGHLTGTLRVHLILQKATSEKVLESSLQQYSTDYEILENKFKMMEKKYDKEKKVILRSSYNCGNLWVEFGGYFRVFISMSLHTLLCKTCFFLANF